MTTAGIFKRIILLSLLFLLKSSALFGQIKLHLDIKTWDHHPLESGELLVQEGDSVVHFSIIKAQTTDLILPKAGLYSVQLASSSYETFEVERFFSTDSTLNIFLDKPAVALGEVVVTGKVSPKVTATGEIFKLSKKAKASGDPFRALSEIPLLQVDISSQSVKMRTGESPLILVDGHLVNSGIQPIHPENIESVEVSEVVSARYLQMGVSKIVNIRLRKDIPFYSYVDLRTRHDIPPREGFAGANFELGKKTFAVAGGAFVDYLTNDRIRYVSKEQMGQEEKSLSGISNAKSRGIDGHLLLKWVPSPSDYFSALIKAKTSRKRTEGKQEGTYTALGKASSLKTTDNNSVLDGGMLEPEYTLHIFQVQPWIL